MNTIAELMGCCQKELHAILWTLSGAIIDDAALYAFLLHEGKEVDWKPDSVNIYMPEYNIESCEDDNSPHSQFYKNIMLKLGYIATEPDYNDVWDLIYTKDECIPVTIKLRRINNSTISIIPNYSATCCEFRGVDFDNLREMRVIIGEKSDTESILRYKSRGFRVFEEL